MFGRNKSGNPIVRIFIHLYWFCAFCHPLPALLAVFVFLCFCIYCTFSLSLCFYLSKLSLTVRFYSNITEFSKFCATFLFTIIYSILFVFCPWMSFDGSYIFIKIYYFKSLMNVLWSPVKD